MSEKNNTKRDDLDRSIDIGMDQFGRFAKRRWIWLVLFSLVLWYFFFNMLPQLSAPSPGTVLGFVFQIGFAVMFIIIQFGALFWFLGRPRLYWVLPGQPGVSYCCCEAPMSSRRWGVKLYGVSCVQVIQERAKVILRSA